MAERLKTGQRVFVSRARRRTPYGYRDLREVNSEGMVLTHWPASDRTEEVVDVVLSTDVGGIVVSASRDQVEEIVSTTHSKESHEVHLP